LQASNFENGWLGQHQRMTDTTDAANPIVEMGARVYLPRLAKFTAPDPVEGGVGDADYLYPTDPINDFELEGSCLWDLCIAEAATLLVFIAEVALILFAIVAVIVTVAVIYEGVTYLVQRRGDSIEYTTTFVKPLTDLPTVKTAI
jgi:hypothetical protein